MRIKIISLAIISIFLFIALGIFNLQIIQGTKFKKLSDSNCIRLLPQAGARGRILDRNKELIAGNYLSYDVMLLPQETGRADKALAAISGILRVGLEDLKKRFKENYVSPFIPVMLVKNIGLKKAVSLGELKSDYNNIIIQPHPLRFYPYGRLACHVIGYLNEIDHWRLTKLKNYGYKTKDIVGFGGIEEKYDYYLRQEDGALSIQVDHRGKFVRVLGFRPPGDGKDIQLTLDIGLQKIAEDALANKRGSVILMEPSSGEIIAMASSPDFDPSVFIDKPNFPMNNLAHSALINRAISGAYPAASVFKLVVASAALETRKINQSSTYFCSGAMRIGNRQFNCWDKHGKQNLADALAYSCDVFFYNTGILLGPQLLHDYALKFGLSRPTAIDLPYEAGGFVPDALWKKLYRLQKWFDGDTANFSIGQGDLLVTPIQLTRLMGVFANKGMLATPYIVKGIDTKDISGQRKRRVAIAIKKSVINLIRQELRGVVSRPSGTANVLSALPVSVAGKTGTAQASRGRTHGWFVGFFPFDKPKFVICVFLENNGSGHMACVLAKQIIKAIISNQRYEKS